MAEVVLCVKRIHSLSLHAVMVTTGNQCIKSFTLENSASHTSMDTSDNARQADLYLRSDSLLFLFSFSLAR